MPKLTKTQSEKLWGTDGPYSQANIIIQTRILDDQVSRVFIEVEIDVNPLTYEIVSQNRTHFKNDPVVTQFINHADFCGLEHGYTSCAFSGEYLDESVMKEAEHALEYSKAAIIRMHQFVMDELNKADLTLDG